MEARWRQSQSPLKFGAFEPEERRVVEGVVLSQKSESRPAKMQGLMVDKPNELSGKLLTICAMAKWIW